MPTGWTLLELIHDRVDRGGLPPRQPAAVSSGPGDRRACQACDAPILHADIQYDVEATEGRFRLHARCYLLWRVDLIRRGWLLIT